MAKKEKNTTKKKRKLLKAALIILGLGICFFACSTLFGELLLARDFLYTAIFADSIIGGCSLASKAINAIKNKSSNQNSKSCIDKSIGLYLNL